MTTTELGLPALRSGSAAPRDPARPDDPRLVDRFGRVATDLRISLTDRCNLRCTYCMPAEGLPWMPRAEQLTDAELVRLITIAVRDLGVHELRFTGGEPLLRRGLEDVIAASAALTPRPDISLTTNGVGLARRAATLAAAGVNRLNVSLDTLRPDRFAEITRRDRLGDVLDGMAAAREAGLSPVKINTVLLRGVNDDEAPALLGWALREGYQMRFIEQMPLDAQHGWDRSAMVTADEILDRLRTAYALAPLPDPDRGSAPAETWAVLDGPDRAGWAEQKPRVGVVGSVTRPFCGDCDRVRLTADGQLRNCLFATTESDLRTAMRAGADDEELARRFVASIAGKKAGHGIDDPNFRQPERPMSAIGG